MQRFNSNWFKQKQVNVSKPLWLLSLFQVLMSLAAIFFAFFSRQTIDQALESTESTSFLIYVVILGSLLLTQLILSTVTPYMKTSYTIRLENQLKRNMLHQLLNNQLKAIETYHSGDLLNHLTSDLRIISSHILEIIPRFIFYIIRFVGSFILLFLIDPLLSIIILGFGILLLLGSRLLAQPMKKRHKAMQEAETHVRSMIQESLANIPVIKSFETEDHIVNNLVHLQNTYYQSVLKKQKLTMLTSFGMTGFLAIGYGLAIVFGAIRLSTDAISIGGLVAIIQLIGYLQSPFSGISQLIPKYYQMTASIERMRVLDDLASDVKNEVNEYAFDRLTASHLSFSYQNDYIIKDLSFVINRGDIIQITGPSGKGKTTLIKLMLSLYEPTSGDLSIEIGKNKMSLSPSFRRLFSYVPQNHMIMSGTIKENLSFYQEASDDQLWQVLTFVDLDDDVKKLPLGLNTRLGEKGVGLSEGQLQRLAIARALLKDAPIILLDEITSGLDEKTEQHVLKNIQTLAHKTIIIISHRQLPNDFIKTYIHL